MGAKYSNPLYSVWCGMLRRCESPKFHAWKYYGGRGIKVCKRWHDLDKFIADMGPRPEGATLDRWPDKNGSYKPGNCRWATWKQQARNRSSNKLISFDGRTMTMWEWADEMDIDPFTLSSRLRHGWSVEEALSIPSPRKSGVVIRRPLWAAMRKLGTSSLADGRKELDKIRVSRYRREHPERFVKPRKIHTKCRHCNNPPLVGTSLCWDHSWSNPEYRKSYQASYRGPRS